MISVVIPNFNQKQYIREAVESVLAQTYEDYEIIVVDDGSTDDSKGILDEYGTKIRYIWQENQGLAGARNTGIRAARGEFVAFLDADDCWLPGYLAGMAALIERHPQAAVYYCCAQCIDAAGEIMPQQVGAPTTAVDSREKMYQTLIRGNFLIPSTITARKNVLDSANLFDQNLRYCEDIDLWLRIAREQTFVGTDACLVHYRIHGSSLSTNPEKTQQTKLKVIEKHFGPDDGNWSAWNEDKRRAFGGAYRFQVLTYIQQANDWQAAGASLRKALLADPTLATDIDLFYEIALGSQPKGYRLQAETRLLEENARLVQNLLQEVFASSKEHAAQLSACKRSVYGSAYYAIGLALYNAGGLAQSRRYLWRAGRYRPSLWFSSTLLGTLLKSMLGDSLLKRLRGWKQK